MKDIFEFYSQLRLELSRWLEQSGRMDGPGPNGGGEDEADEEVEAHIERPGSDGLMSFEGLLKESAFRLQLREVLGRIGLPLTAATGCFAKDHGTTTMLVLDPVSLDRLPAHQAVGGNER